VVVLQDLVDQRMLDVDPSSVGASEVAHELEARRAPEWFIGQQVEECLGVVPESCRGQSPRILLGAA
jgi:hypothetical protein